MNSPIFIYKTCSYAAVNFLAAQLKEADLLYFFWFVVVSWESILVSPKKISTTGKHLLVLTMQKNNNNAQVHTHTTLLPFSSEKGIVSSKKKSSSSLHRTHLTTLTSLPSSSSSVLPSLIFKLFRCYPQQSPTIQAVSMVMYICTQ